MDEYKVKNGYHTYVMYTKSILTQEVKGQLEKYLLTEDEEVYTPLIQRVKRTHGEDLKVVQALFPGYIFIDTKNPHDLFLRIMLVP